MNKEVCIVCDRTKWKEELTCSSFKLLRCKTCGLVKTKVIGKAKGPGKEIYESRGEVEKQFATQAQKFQKYAKELLDLLPTGGGSLLDVGSGPGWLVAEAAGRGYVASGIDPSKVLVEFGKRNLKVKLTASPFEHYTTREKFDTNVLKHVLEHVPDPNKFLQKARSLLAPSGTVLVACPNINSLMYRLFRDRWYGLVPAQHRWQFAPKTLVMLLEKNGFKIERIAVNSLDYDAKGIKGKILDLLVVLASILGLGDQVIVVAQGTS